MSYLEAIERNATARKKFKLLYVATHPIQYLSPLLRKMAADSRFSLLVAYCNMDGAQAATDPGFGVSVQWDVPLLEGYDWVQLSNHAPRTGAGGFFC